MPPTKPSNERVLLVYYGRETLDYLESGNEALKMGTYDLASAVDRVKAIDEALKHYYGAKNWLAIRRKLQPGINQHQEEVSHATQYQDE